MSERIGLGTLADAVLFFLFGIVLLGVKGGDVTVYEWHLFSVPAHVTLAFSVIAFLLFGVFFTAAFSSRAEAWLEMMFRRPATAKDWRLWLQVIIVSLWLAAFLVGFAATWLKGTVALAGNPVLYWLLLCVGLVVTISIPFAQIRRMRQPRKAEGMWESPEGETARGVRGSFTVTLVSCLFEALKRFSPLECIIDLVRRAKRRRLEKEEERRLVDAWALLNLVASAAVFAALPLTVADSWHWSYLLYVYVALRVLEVPVAHLNLLLFDRFRSVRKGNIPKPLDYRRILILVVLNYLEFVFWFAFVYRNLDSAFTVDASYVGYASWYEFWNLSFASMSGFGRTGLTAVEGAAKVLGSVQSVLGFTFAVLVIGSIVGTLTTIGRGHTECENQGSNPNGCSAKGEAPGSIG